MPLKNAAERLEKWPISRFKPFARNPRTHSPAQISQLAASMRTWGWTIPVLANEDGTVIAGHGRLLAAPLVGIEDVPVLVAEGWSPEMIRAYVIADNKLTENGGWNRELLAEELAELQALGFDTLLTGFSDKEIGELLLNAPGADPDDAPPLPAVPLSQPGEIWTLGQHRVACGSAHDAALWARLMDGVSADVVWTDPPYNVDYEGTAGKIQNDAMSGEAFAEFLAQAFERLVTVMKPGAAIYVAHADTEGLAFRRAFTEAGLKLASCLIWRKDSLVLGRSDYQWIHEPILYGWKPGAAHRFYGGRKQSTVEAWAKGRGIDQLADGRWAIAWGDSLLVVDGKAEVVELPTTATFVERPRRSAEHPTMKPVSLVERHLAMSARPGAVVVDAFGGSGSTLIAADRQGMCARLVELDPRYVDVIVRRWQTLTGLAAVDQDGQPFDATQVKPGKPAKAKSRTRPATRPVAASKRGRMGNRPTKARKAA
ncbi:site-specific DNA-methyltransferase [Cupriavidus sp. AcVe19-6a]|uniref:site-specific DNA-methyltransferase n=1 Tax=Cupriavidus sp. AcVe19-6a TaxID=2821358 RepID=UPI001AE610E6|nr:site-specific DNA-methyltransferase [Cupriavidus sp. AcVe19-6a]MBP0634895.1 site-specific DNA-methyltransferase [Cupriavidus sp. AcVe19-6a]